MRNLWMILGSSHRLDVVLLVRIGGERHTKSVKTAAVQVLISRRHVSKVLAVNIDVEGAVARGRLLMLTVPKGWFK